MAKSAQKKKQVAKAKSPQKSAVPAPIDPAEELGKELLSWSAHPFLEQRRKGGILVLSTIAFLALVWYAFDLLSAVIALAITVGAFSSFLLPSKYSLREKGISYHNGVNTLNKKWWSFESYHVFADGVQLMYNQRRLRERILRGFFVYYGGQDPERVKKLIAEGLAAADE